MRPVAKKARSAISTSRLSGRRRSPPSPADRIVFWEKLHERLTRLANRIDSKTQDAIIVAVAARIPIPTQDERLAVQLEDAQADARNWAAFSEMQTDEIAGLKEMAKSATEQAAKREPAAAAAAKVAKNTADRLARAERGEDVGSAGAPLTQKDLMRMVGWKPSDLQHALRLGEIDKLGGTADLLEEILRRHRLGEKAASRDVLLQRLMQGAREGTVTVDEVLRRLAGEPL